MKIVVSRAGSISRHYIPEDKTLHSNVILSLLHLPNMWF
jgi:hypothetical protein